MQCTELLQYLNRLLNVEAFHDYAPNGLQVEGRKEVKRIILGVTASQALVDEAVCWGADMLLVHHGWFWKGESANVVGMKRNRLRALLCADINLVAYHLPLDAHNTLGNNAQLAKLLGLKPLYQCGESDLVWVGEPAEGSISGVAFIKRVQSVLQRTPTVLGELPQNITKLAWCTGAAQDWVQLAAQECAQLYLSGEASERTTHEAIENGIAYIGAGHHATERYGIQALGEHLKSVYPELEIRYVEIDNPI